MAKQKTSKRKSPKPVKAWAWEIQGGLCYWAETDRGCLELGTKPSPEAKPICVMLVPLGEYRRMVKALKGK